MLGGPGTLEAWVCDLIRQACGRAGVAVHNVGRYADAVGPSDGTTRVLLARFPDRALMDVIEARRTPVVVVLDDPIDCVRFLRAKLGCDLLEALRQQTACAAAHFLLHGDPDVFVVRRGMADPAREVGAALIAYLGLPISDDDREAVLDACCGAAGARESVEAALAARVPGYARLDQLSEAVSTQDGATIRQVLSPLIIGAISKDIGPITWPANVFYFGDSPNQVAPKVVDLTGHIRPIYYGPYFHLPPGQWLVRCIIAFTIEARHLPFKLVLMCDLKPIAKVLFRPEAEGAFEGLFTAVHTQPESSVEINLINEEGSIGGHMALGQITFTRMG